MATPTQAPTLEKGALTPVAPAAASADLQNLLTAAFRFGWALEELVWRLNDMARQADAPAPPSPPPGSDFPPDLTHERSPAEHVRELRKLLEVDGQKLMGDIQSVSAQTVGTRIDALLQAYENKQSVAPLLTGDQRIGSLVGMWDADIVDAIINNQPTEVLTAYELGKALSVTSWRIGTAAVDVVPATDLDPVAKAWDDALSTDRVGQIRRHLTTLTGPLDPQTVVSVSASLGFWRRAYDRGYLCGSADPDTQHRIPGADSPKRTDLQRALDQQLANWYDLLTGRRRLDSFPVTGVVTSLMRKYAQTQWSRFAPGVLVAGGVLVIVLVVGVLVSVALGGNVGAGAGAGVTGGLTTLFGFLVARGAGLLDRGSQAVQDLESRVSQLQAQLASASAQNQPPQLTFESLGRSVLSQVVAQLRLEEAKLAISQPLIDYIAQATNADKSKGPQQVAEDFLKKILAVDEQSNMDRLQNVLDGLYQGYKPLIPGAP